MSRPVIALRATAAFAVLVAASPALAQSDASGRHEWLLELTATYASASSPLDGWPEGGLGKLRFGAERDGLKAARLLAAYRGRLGRTLWATVVADYIDDPAGGLDLTEAYIELRPVPRSAAEQRVRIGAFYPPLSLENGERGWESPFTQSFSAVNTWLGEEIRPIGAEWSMRRRLGLGSAQELRPFAAAFYGNDPAGTLLFWRGWSLHDRQTRLNDRLAMPPLPLWSGGVVIGTQPQSVEPIEEIDGKAGAYAGIEWRYARRALLQLAHYDNRADPMAFRDGQWGWDTAFTQLAVQLALPGDFGLIAQWLEGSTYWVSGARADGTLAPAAELVDDGFAANYAMLTRVFRGKHRAAVRYDRFSVERHEASPALLADAGRAWTLAYRYVRPARFAVGLEWLRIESRRDLWPAFYAAAPRAKESQLRLGVELKLDTSR